MMMNIIAGVAATATKKSGYKNIKGGSHMKGYPKIIGTKQDIYNLFEIAKIDDEIKEKLAQTLDNLIATKKHYVLKAEAVEKPAEEQTPDDYELVDNPNADIFRFGMTEEEIAQIKNELEIE